MGFCGGPPLSMQLTRSLRRAQVVATKAPIPAVSEASVKAASIELARYLSFERGDPMPDQFALANWRAYSELTRRLLTIAAKSAA